MKTKLLLLLFFAFSIGNAQINVSEGFESGALPAGWTTTNIDGVVISTQSCSGTQSVRANYYANTFAVIYTSSYISNGGAINVSYTARKQIGAFFGTKYLYYEVNGSGTWTQIASQYSDFSTCTSINATIAQGIISNGSSVKFRMQVNSASSSNVTYLYFDDFIATQSTPTYTPQSITTYNFDNTYTNILGSEPFASNAATSFTSDRHGTTTGALNMSIGSGAFGTSANIIGLPYAADARTVSVWVKLNNYDTGSFINPIFFYGTSNTDRGFGGTVDYGEASILGFNNNYVIATTNNLSTWYHYVYTYDGTDAKIYKDGVLLGSQTKTWNTLNNSNLFSIGTGYYGSLNGAIDDLKIYNYALSQTEVTSLFTNNSLSSNTFNQNNLDVSLYPNPVKNVLNIEMTNAIKSVEIYNIQGMKVRLSNQKQVNVSGLASGMYMVKIQDVDNNSATKKIIIK